MNKRVLRKFAIPSSSPNPKNGIFCADQVKYVVRTAIKNIDHQRTLVLYIHAKESVLAGNHTPRWTMFQQKGGYITLCTDDKGTRWQQSMLENLGKDYFFRDKCSFYSQADERRVTRYCQSEKQKGFESLCLFQLDLLRKKQRENELKKQRRIIKRMKPVGALPRDIKGFMHRETLPHYIFYDYAKGKAPKNAYCTACKHNVSVAEAKHNGEGVCPHCKRKITFKSRGRRGYIVDRSTAQVIQRLGSNEMIIRFVKAYRRYPKSDTPEFHVYENARLFLQWDGSVLNSKGKTVTEVLGVGKKYIPLLQTIDPGPNQLTMFKAFLRDNIRPDLELMKWCSKNDIGEEAYITVPLRYMTPHKLMRYATEQFATHRKTSYYAPGYYSMREMMSDYKDYLCMCELLEHDMKSSFVLFPNDLKAEHDRVNDMSRNDVSQAYDRRIAKMFEGLQHRYGYTKMGFVVIPPHSAKEITREGDKLHHCVGRYVKDVVKNNTTILFIRKASAPKKPYCTVEVKHGDVIQARIQNNVIPPPKVKRFIENWKENVLYAPALERAA